jgi:predicted nucleic acid-binding protein
MIVFDSSTLILLAKIELLDIFLQDYKKKIIIPQAVEKESVGKETFDGLLIKKRIEEGKITAICVASKEVQQVTEDFNLGAGEAEALVLAKKEGALLATDDRKAIQACKILHVRFTTAIDFVIRAEEKKKITKKQAQTKIEQLAEYGRYKSVIIEDAKKQLGE